MKLGNGEYCMGLPQWLSSKESACNAEDAGLIPGLGRSPGGQHGTPLQYSYLEYPRGAWWAIVRGVAESDTAEHTHTLKDIFPVRFSPDPLPVFLISGMA